MKRETILITGGTGKFGRTFVRYFIEQGCTVIFTSRSDEGINSLLAEHAENKSSLIGLKVDLTQEMASIDLVEQINSKELFPTVLINNARSLEHLKLENDGLVSRNNFVGEMIVDVISPYELSMALFNMENSKLKCIVNIGSMYGQVATNPALYNDHAKETAIHYGVAKAALGHLTKELAVRFATHDIRVNCIAFGGVEGRVDDEFKGRYATLVPMRRMLKDDEIIGPVKYLISDESSGMTGQVMSVDGGWSIW